MSKHFRWIHLHSKLAAILGLSITVILLNIAAYKHAHAMLNFAQAGGRTEPPESLSLWQKIKILLTGVHIPKPLNHSMPDSWGLPFETHRFKVNHKIELEAWHIPHPQAKGLVLLFHGYASCKARLLPEASSLHELGYATFLVDFRGSGGSSDSETSIGFYEADDVVKAIEYIRSISAHQPLILYGRSMGGAAILRAIYANGIQPDAIIIEAVFDKMLSTVQNRFAAMGVPSFPAAQLLLFWGSVQSRYSGFKHNPVEYATRVQCQVLMLHGTDDPRATIKEGMAVFQSLDGKKQFEAFASVGHEAYLAAKPQQWQYAVAQFLVQYHDTTT